MSTTAIKATDPLSSRAITTIKRPSLSNLPEELLLGLQSFLDAQTLCAVSKGFYQTLGIRKKEVFHKLQEALLEKVILGKHYSLFLSIFLDKKDNLDKVKAKLRGEMILLGISNTDAYKKLFNLESSFEDLLHADDLTEQENFRRAKGKLYEILHEKNIFIPNVDTFEDFQIAILALTPQEKQQPLNVDLREIYLTRLPLSLLQFSSLTANFHPHLLLDIALEPDFLILRNALEQRVLGWTDQKILIDLARDGNLVVIDTLFKVCYHIQINFQNKYGTTLLMGAAIGGHPDLCGYLLGKDGIDSNRPNDRGLIPLMAAISQGHTKTALVLLSDPRVDVNRQLRIMGLTALMLAASTNNRIVVKALIDDPRTVLSLTNKRGFTAEDIAFREGFRSIADLFPLASIETLDLSGNPTLTDEDLQQIVLDNPKLRGLDLMNCPMITDRGLRHLGKLPLVKLNLFGCRMSDVGISYLNAKTLRSLNLGNCPNIIGPGLKCLENLEYLDLFNCQIEDASLHFIKSLPIRVLMLARCFNISNDGLFFLQDLIQLRELNLSGCWKIKDKGLSYLSKLSLGKLNLSRIYITDRGILFLLPIRSLRTLILDENGGITNKGIGDLRCLPLKVLSLKGTWNVNKSLAFDAQTAPPALKLSLNMSRFSKKEFRKIFDTVGPIYQRRILKELLITGTKLEKEEHKEMLLRFVELFFVITPKAKKKLISEASKENPSVLQKLQKAKTVILEDYFSKSIHIPEGFEQMVRFAIELEESNTKERALGSFFQT